MHPPVTALLRPSRFAPALALLLTGGLFMGASPSPVPSGHGPMAAVAPGGAVPVPTGPLFPAPSVDPLDAPSGGGPGVPMPADLVGAWYTGDVGSIGYVDPNSGAYSDGSTTGLAYTFYPDGTWQYGWLMTSTLYGCSMRVLVFRQGTVAAADETKHYADLDTTLSQMHSEDSCVAENNYDRDLPPDDETIIWERTTDQYGDALLLRSPSSGFSVFRPAQSAG
jgi:hypothetical protein